MSDIVATADPATRLAFDRTRLAAERTLLAWFRTALSMISFGFAFSKFFQSAELPGVPPGFVETVRTIAFVLVVLGTLLLAVASMENLKVSRRISEYVGEEFTPFTALLGAAILALLGLATLGYLTFELIL